MKKLLKIVCLSLSSIVASPLVGAATETPSRQGRVVFVQDGDSMKVAVGSRLLTLRLQGIDTPEKGQPFATEATRFVKKKVMGRTVTFRMSGLDLYHRIVAEVILNDGHSLNRELVAAGLAWRDPRYSRDSTLKKLEKKARSERRGLWAMPDPLPPWEWRRDHRRRGNHFVGNGSPGS
ncbi:MAG: thermonuclease family protein [Magnetococcales bacterium]|nr:thermonuclease family protein [Magnetococcales bacterium]